MRTLLSVVFVLGLYATTALVQISPVRGQTVPVTTAQKSMQPDSVKPTPLSDGFIRPATKAFTTIKESAKFNLRDHNMPADDRINEAGAAASNPADKAFVVAIKDYETQKAFFSVLYDIQRTTAELKAKNGGAGVPAWSCAPFEDEDVCPSFQAAVKSLLVANRDLANKQVAVEDCEDFLASALKIKAFGAAPICGIKSKSEPK